MLDKYDFFLFVIIKLDNVLFCDGVVCSELYFGGFFVLLNIICLE